MNKVENATWDAIYKATWNATRDATNSKKRQSIWNAIRFETNRNRVWIALKEITDDTHLE